MIRNKIICADVIEGLRQIPDNSIDLCITSPPYHPLRDYGIPPTIWDGDPECQHEWGVQGKSYQRIRHGQGSNLIKPPFEPQLHPSTGSFCLKCGCWLGCLGLEPTFSLYLDHLMQVFTEVRRVLKPTGSCWINLGDSFSGSKIGNTDNKNRKANTTSFTKHQSAVPRKSLCAIPERFAVAMTDSGWIRRNTIIWKKNNCMPSSASDRFTVDFEYFYWFTKSNKPKFWTNSKTLELVTKRPLGTKGVEGKDWEWRQVGRSEEEEEEFKKTIVEKGAIRDGKNAPTNLRPENTKGKLKKVSLWQSHDYFFEPQYEELQEESKRRAMRGNGNNKYVRGTHLPQGVHPNTMSQPRPYRGYDNMGIMIARGETSLNPLGRNKRTVWNISTHPFPEAHFATFPPVLVETPILACCPQEVCNSCGMGRVKVYETTYKLIRTSQIQDQPKQKAKHEDNGKGTTFGFTKSAVANALHTPTGLTTCSCSKDAGYSPGITLDPFMGAGTAGLVAKQLGRDYVGIEIKAEYVEMAERRIREEGLKPKPKKPKTKPKTIKVEENETLYLFPN